MPTLKVFDPPLCCSTGVCGPEADDVLVTFSGALRWLQRQGVTVERYNPASNPDVFMDTAIVYDALMREGQDVLPLVLVDGEIAYRGEYPSRDDLAQLVGLEPA
jgi:hypothetical protein